MDKIKKSFIVILVLTLVVSYLPVNTIATSSVKNYFNIREIVNKKKENISDQDKLKIKLLNKSVDESKITISVNNLTEIEKYFNIKDNQIVISEVFMSDNQFTETDKSLILRLINQANHELVDSNLKVNEDYQIIDKGDNSAYLNGGNVNKKKQYWWGVKAHRSKKNSTKIASDFMKASKAGKTIKRITTLISGFLLEVPAAAIINKFIGYAGTIAGVAFKNISVNLTKVNNGKYGTIIDLPWWIAGYGIKKQTNKTK